MESDGSARKLSVALRSSLLALLCGFPATLIALYLLVVSNSFSFGQKWGLGVLLLAIWIGAAARLCFEVRQAFEQLFGLLSSFREGDYTVRLVAADTKDAYAGCIDTINRLGQKLSSTRLQSAEAALFLEAVSEEVEAGTFLLEGDRIKWLNRAGASLLKGNPASLMGKTASESGLDVFLASVRNRENTKDIDAGSAIRWEVKEKVVYEKGSPHRLLIIADITESLRNEERSAWRRMVRVLSHEINNSLTPLKTLSSELAEAMECTPRPIYLDEDIKAGLRRIAARSDKLGRFISGYAKLMNLPPPTKRNILLSDLVVQVAALERRTKVRVTPGPTVHLLLDQVQIEQAFINLLKNAAEATLEASGSVVDVGWSVNSSSAIIFFRDEGSGISPNQNLFIPFYTTKPNGAGIGLVFCREIIEAHRGRLQLRNRRDGSGCEAVVELPL